MFPLSLLNPIYEILKKKEKKYVSKDDALNKLQRYCAYQDRCHQEVENKLREYGIFGEDADDIMVELINDKFLDEERFARSYARGKFRMKKWGRTKIKQELKLRAVSKYCIKKAMTEIEEEAYQKVLREMLRKKTGEYKGKFYERKIKAARFAMNKGFESTLTWKLANELEEEHDTQKSETDREKLVNGLRRLIEKKMKSYKGNFYEKKMKTAQYAVSKGYASNLVWDHLNQLEA